MMKTKTNERKKVFLAKNVMSVLLIISIVFSLNLFTVNAAPNNITPENKSEDQIKYALVTNQDVIKKWASLGHFLGFGWAAGTAGQYVGEDFSVKRLSNGDYEVYANYREGDPYSDGYRAEERLKMIFSDFRVTFDPDDFNMEQPQVTLGDERVAGSFLSTNATSSMSSVNQEYSYSTAHELTHETNTTLGATIGISQTTKAGVNIGVFSAGAEVTTKFEFSAEHGWKNSTTKSSGDTITNSFSAVAPPHTKTTLSQIAQDVLSSVEYSTDARIEYSVTFIGFLRNGGNSNINHPIDRPDVTLKFGSDTISAADHLWDLYTNRNIPGYNNWIDWNTEGLSSGLEQWTKNIYNSPEVTTVEGKFVYKGVFNSMRASEPVPLYPLARVEIEDRIRPIYVGENFDLKKLKLTGLNNYNFDYYGFNNLPVTWKIESGENYGLISGIFLIGEGEGHGTISATVNGIESNVIGFGVKSPSRLSFITVTGVVPPSITGESFNLSNLDVTGFDQYGNPYDISMYPVDWEVVNGKYSASVLNSRLHFDNDGKTDLVASVNGIRSNEISFTIKNPPYLDKLILSGTIPVLEMGAQYDLSKLRISGEDQYGNNYDVSNKIPVFKIIEENEYASVYGITLTVLNQNNFIPMTGLVNASINGVTSNAISFRTQKEVSPTPVPDKTNRPTSTTVRKTTADSISLKSNDASIKNLFIDGVELLPEFRPDTLVYNGEVENNVTSVEVSYETSDKHADVKVDGDNNLNVGVNTITVTVKAEDGTAKTYIIIINRKEETKEIIEPEEQKPSVGFVDTAGHWAEHQIIVLQSMGIITGYEDGSVKPDRELTRAELAIILVKTLKIPYNFVCRG